ncbi:MAG: PfkB family carbohydrate kinase [Solirubrobacteraceae bacterium]
MSAALQVDYLAVGHVTVDVVADGTRRAGGTALYSALQAARLGARAMILTRGVAAEIESLLEPFAGELELRIQPAGDTTTLATCGVGVARRQRMLAWAGPVELSGLPGSAILHLAPVAAELSGRPAGRFGFRGLTPQGLARGWARPGAEVVPRTPGPEQDVLAEGCDAVVLSDQERAFCAGLLERARAGGAIVAITAGPGPNQVVLADGEVLGLPVQPLQRPADDLGAGDVYASAFFIALAEGVDPRGAAALGNAAAALRMEGVGPAAIADRAALLARLAGA